MQNLDKISIVIPVYNSDKWIDECLNSVRNQTYKNIEVIIVNDGSTDKSEIKIRNHCKADDRLIMFSINNKGVSNARNFGITQTTGKYICFVDSDDVIKNDYCEKMYINAIEKDVDLVICGYSKKDIKIDNIGIEEFIILNNCDVSQDIEDNMILLYQRGMLNPIWNKLYIRDILTNIRFREDVSSGEDLLFNLEYFNYIHSIAFEECCLYQYKYFGVNNKTKLDLYAKKAFINYKNQYQNIKRICCSKIKFTNYIDSVCFNELLVVIRIVCANKKCKDNILLDEVLKDEFTYEIMQHNNEGLRKKIYASLIHYKLKRCIYLLLNIENIARKIK